MVKNNFSVLISIYYKENPSYFREALDSIFLQTLLPSEIVLVEDGPLTPSLYSVIDEFKSRYPIFNIVKNEVNLGLGLALAKGVNACSNEYILRMDTDDVIPPRRFEKEIAKLNEGYDVVSCWSLLFEDSIDNVIAIKRRPEFHEDIVKLAHKRSPLCHAATAFRRSAVLSVGNYEHHLYYEDYNLWVRMILGGYKFYNIQEVLYYVRTSSDMVKRRGGLTYLKNEISEFRLFMNLGFYTKRDFFINIITRLLVRVMPVWMRSLLLKRIWNTKQK